ncbi:MAG: FKBP-type peptidyl-prolyl cis-trans isomerase [Bacteroidaceae bacterium]|nr:FKBP-type peptidyl-prolyl cis-trans isomerase [Bacteroidaceae bacterium]
MSVKDSIAAAKAAAKAAKAQKAQELKEFKAKQAADLKAFIEAQKAGKPTNGISLGTPALNNADDSIAYIFGVAQSRGLKQYVTGQLNVDTTHINKFVEGVLYRTSVDPNDKENHAYAAGYSLGGQVEMMTNNLSKEWFAATPEKKIDIKIVATALMQGLLGQNSISADEAGRELQEKGKKRQEENMEAMYGDNRRAGEKFLEENKKKEGVVTLPSGLQYKVLLEGDKNSEKAKRADKVKVNYEGRLIDGTVFDSSYKRKEPAIFQANQVIKGWTEALMLMPVGSRWELYIPYQLAYGDREQGKDIKPYSALVFTVELLENVTANEVAAKRNEGSNKDNAKSKKK